MEIRIKIKKGHRETGKEIKNHVDSINVVKLNVVNYTILILHSIITVRNLIKVYFHQILYTMENHLKDHQKIEVDQE